MKTKLLKKIRKRYTIVHYPNGIRLWGKYYDKNIIFLIDRNAPAWARWRNGFIINPYVEETDSKDEWWIYRKTFERAYESAYNLLKKKIYSDYKHLKAEKKDLSGKKLWH